MTRSGAPQAYDGYQGSPKGGSGYAYAEDWENGSYYDGGHGEPSCSVCSCLARF